MSGHHDSPTKVDLDSQKGTATVGGPAWAVITIIALLGMIVISILALNLGRSAIIDAPERDIQERQELRD